MNKNTAIFYDVENLLKGYGVSKDYINSISLKKIFQEVKKVPEVGRIIVQKAYANWSDSRLSVMKREINELGIEPVQIFGFSYYQKKNAADIQLAVDAIDLAYIRESIDIFVIVSGDGGFSAVAKKLHEYGKYVVGCGYKSSTNHILESLCDYFIGIEEPEEELHEEKNEIEKVLKITNPLVLKMSQSIGRLTSDNRQEIIAKSLEILDWFTKDKEGHRELSNSGIHLSVMKEAFKYGIENFDSSRIGLSKFIQFLQYICRDTDLKVVTSDKFQTKIAYRESTIVDFEPLPFLDDSFLHSAENYKSILATGHPRIKVINPADFLQITSTIACLPERKYTLDALLEQINAIYGDIESENINHCLLSLISLEIFDLADFPSNLSDKLFTLKPEYRDHRMIIKTFQESVNQKLSSFWGEDLRKNIIEQLIVDF